MKITKTVYHELSERIGPADAAMIAYQMEQESIQSDIDTTPLTIRVKCSSCLKVEKLEIIGEELENYTRNEDGTYTSIQGECTACLIGESQQ